MKNIELDGAAFDKSLLDGLVVHVALDLDQMRDHVAAPALLGIPIDPLDKANRLTLGEVVAIAI